MAADHREIFGKRLLKAAAQYCCWPDGLPIRLKGLGVDAPTAQLLGGYVYDVHRLAVKCECSTCATKPTWVGGDESEDDTSIRTLLSFAFHASGPALQTLETALYDSGLDDDDVAQALLQQLTNVLYVMDVPHARRTEAAEAGLGGPQAEGAGATSNRGVLPLSAFLQQTSHAAGGAALLGRRVWVHAFSVLNQPNNPQAPEAPDESSVAGGADAPTPALRSAAPGGPNKGVTRQGTSGGTSRERGAHPPRGDTSLFSGRLEAYETATGLYRVHYEPGQALDLWQLPGEEYDTLHLAVCHVEEEAEKEAEGPRGPKAGSGGGRRRGLEGPFVGCVEAVPSDWQTLVPGLLRQPAPPALPPPLSSSRQEEEGDTDATTEFMMEGASASNAAVDEVFLPPGQQQDSNRGPLQEPDQGAGRGGWGGATASAWRPSEHQEPGTTSLVPKAPSLGFEGGTGAAAAVRDGGGDVGSAEVVAEVGNVIMTEAGVTAAAAAVGADGEARRREGAHGTDDAMAGAAVVAVTEAGAVAEGRLPTTSHLRPRAPAPSCHTATSACAERRNTDPGTSEQGGDARRGKDKNVVTEHMEEVEVDDEEGLEGLELLAELEALDVACWGQGGGCGLTPAARAQQMWAAVLGEVGQVRQVREQMSAGGLQGER